MSGPRRALWVIGVLSLVVGWWFVAEPGWPQRPSSGARDTSVVKPTAADEPEVSLPVGVARVDVARFSEQEPPRRLRFVDALSMEPIDRLTIRILNGQTEASDLTVGESGGFEIESTCLQQPTTIEVQVSEAYGGTVFRVGWPTDFERRVLASRMEPEFVARVPVFSRLWLRVAGLPLDLMKRIQVGAQSVPPLPPGDHPLSKNLAMERATYPPGYGRSLSDVGIPDTTVYGSARFDESESAWMVLVPHSGDVFFQMTLRGYVPVARMMECRRGESQDVFLGLNPTPTVSGTVRLDGSPVAGTRVKVACCRELDVGECLAGQGAGGLSLVRRNDTSITTAQLFTSTSTDDYGRFSIPVPFTDRVSIAAFSLEGTNRITRTRGLASYQSVSVDIDARSVSDEARMRLVDSATGQVLGNTVVWFGVRDDPFAVSYPATRSDDNGWFSIEDARGLPMVTFGVSEASPKRSVAIDGAPRPGADLQVVWPQ